MTFQASATQPAQYRIGDLAEFPDFGTTFTNGVNTFGRTGQYVAGSLLNAQVKTMVSRTPLNLQTPANAVLASTGFFNSELPPFAVKGTSITGYMYSNTGTVAISASGIQLGSTGLTLSSGTPMAVLATDGTTFRAYGISPIGPSIIGSSSTDCINFTASSLSGLPATVPNNSTGIVAGFYNFGSPASGYPALGSMYGGAGSGTVYPFFAFWAGARYIIVYAGATNYLACRSSDGVTFGGDETTAILGGAAIARIADQTCWFYRNGNSAFMWQNNKFSRYTSDGGLTWANTSGTTPVISNSQTKFRVNATDPARIMFCSPQDNTTWLISTNSGQTWSAITPPTSAAIWCCGRGGTWLIGDNNSMWVSTNDGSTWSLVATGASGNSRRAFADANRFYAFSYDSNQISTSTTGLAGSWTVRNISNGINSLDIPNFVAATDANTIVMSGMENSNGYMLASTDGGVTWTWTYAGRTNIRSGCYPVTTGTTMFIAYGGSTAILPSELSAPAYYKMGAAAVSPVRAAAITYLTVA